MREEERKGEEESKGERAKRRKCGGGCGGI